MRTIPGITQSTTSLNVEEARRQLTQAIARHERHMVGSEPTSEASQMAMMKEMVRASEALGGPVGEDVSKTASAMKM